MKCEWDQGEVNEHKLKAEAVWVRILAQPLGSCVILGKSFNLSEL